MSGGVDDLDGYPRDIQRFAARNRDVGHELIHRLARVKGKVLERSDKRHVVAVHNYQRAPALKLRRRAYVVEMRVGE